MAEKDLETYLNLSKVIKSNKILLYTDLLKRIISISSIICINIAQQITIAIESKEFEVDILQGSNVVFLAYSYSLEMGILSKADAEIVKNMIAVLKAKCLEFNALLLNKTKKIMGNEYYCTQVMIGSEIELESIQSAVQRGISIVNIKNCLKQLEEHYNLSPDEIGIVKSDFDAVIVRGQSDSRIVRIELYSLKDKQKLDSSICKDRKVSISLPIVNDIEQLDMIRYQDFKNKTIDIYNPNDVLFISRCHTYELNDYDTTINMVENTYMIIKPFSVIITVHLLVLMRTA
jgi:hypothetical protein